MMSCNPIMILKMRAVVLRKEKWKIKLETFLCTSNFFILQFVLIIKTTKIYVEIEDFYL